MTLHGPSRFRAAWESLWRPFVIDPADPSDALVEVHEEDWGFKIRAPGRGINVFEVWQALVESRNDVVRLAIESTPDTVDLHSAVLVREGLALLLLGDAWAGKTTLALQLVQSGWEYFSDDAAIVEVTTGRVRPLPKPPGVKAHPWIEMKHHWDREPVELGPPAGVFVVPPPFTGSLADRAQPTWAVFLRFDEHAPTSVVRLSDGQAVARAVTHLGRLDSTSIAVARRLMEGCEVAELTYGSGAAATAELGRFLAQVR